MQRDLELVRKILFALEAKPHPKAIDTLEIEGYEFLDAVRSDAVWNKVKSQAAEKGTALSFDLLKTIAVEAVKKLFGVGLTEKEIWPCLLEENSSFPRWPPSAQWQAYRRAHRRPV